MKRLLLTFAFAAAVAVAIGYIAYQDKGYVIISYMSWSLETTLVFLLGFLAIFFFLAYYLFRFLAYVLGFPSTVGAKYSLHQAEKARSGLIKGLIEMSEGRFVEAEKILVKHVNQSGTPLLNYLAAARSAQLQGEHNRRDDYLKLAHENTPSAELAIGLTQAELQLAHNQTEQALATLNHLRSLSPNHGYVMKLQARVYAKIGDWDSLCHLLADLRRYKVFPKDKLAQLEVEAHGNALLSAGKQRKLNLLKQTWERIPKHIRDQQEILKIYATQLASNRAVNEAEALLRHALNNKWQDSLVTLYSQLDLDRESTAEQQGQFTELLEKAEGWLKQHPHNAALLLTVGKLCMKQKLWGKARSYIETSIKIRPMAASYQQLAQLLEQMGETEAAQECYRKGLNLAIAERNQQEEKLLPAPKAMTLPAVATEQKK